MPCIYWRVQDDQVLLFLSNVLPGRLLDGAGAFGFLMLVAIAIQSPVN